MPAIPAWAQLVIQVLLYVLQLLTNKQARLGAAEAIKSKRVANREARIKAKSGVA